MKNNHASVIVADDHTLFRKGMALLVSEFPEIHQVYEAVNGADLLSQLKQKTVDIILLDLEMPEVDGWSAARQIIKKHPTIKIIVISATDSLDVISNLIEMGVHSYIVKDSTPEDVHRAIQAALNDEFYYNQVVAKALHSRVKEHADEQNTNLTHREKEILRLICEELTMREISERLFLSEQTIHSHRKNIMRKIDVSNAVGLVKYAISNKLVHF